jgi:hypothetical protein
VTRWSGALPGGRGSVDRVSDHALREQRLDAVRNAVEQFTYDLGLLIAGHDASVESPTPELAQQLQRVIRPFLDAGDSMRPDFGAFGDLRVEGALLEVSHPVLATLEFDDRCARETASGRVVATRGRRLRVTMHVALDPVRVIDCAVSDAGERRG